MELNSDHCSVRIVEEITELKDIEETGHTHFAALKANRPPHFTSDLNEILKSA